MKRLQTPPAPEVRVQASGAWFSRREFLTLATAAGATLVLPNCGGGSDSSESKSDFKITQIEMDPTNMRMTVFGSFPPGDRSVSLHNKDLPILEQGAGFVIAEVSDPRARGEVFAAVRLRPLPTQVSNSLFLSVFSGKVTIESRSKRADITYKDAVEIDAVLRGWLDPSGTPSEMRPTDATTGTVTECEGRSDTGSTTWRLATSGKLPSSSRQNPGGSCSVILRLSATKRTANILVAYGIRDGIRQEDVLPGGGSNVTLGFFGRSFPRPLDDPNFNSGLTLNPDGLHHVPERQFTFEYGGEAFIPALMEHTVHWTTFQEEK